MADEKQVTAAIVDYGLGNLFSVKQACRHVGMQAHITSSKKDILAADVVLLPGVGSYGDAMTALRKLDMVTVLRDIAASSKPLVGICLGMQLLMTESHEFGQHKGLGIIEGTVERFKNPIEREIPLKVPQVGWNRIDRIQEWKETLLANLADGEFMYFVHSYCVHPVDRQVVLSTSQYGNTQFCSSLQQGNIFACQFHPERSGQSGIQIYKNLKAMIASSVA